MFGWFTKQVVTQPDLQSSIDHIESFEILDRFGLIESLAKHIAGGLQRLDQGGMTVKGVLAYSKTAMRDAMSRNDSSVEGKIEYSLLYISLAFFSALTKPEASESKETFTKVLRLLLRGKDSAARTYVMDLFGMKI